jgi:two-component system response regulator DesR
VLQLADCGTPVAVIAKRTHLSHGTVRNHLAAAVHKLGVPSRAEAVRAARDNGWL